MSDGSKVVSEEMMHTISLEYCEFDIFIAFIAISSDSWKEKPPLL